MRDETYSVLVLVLQVLVNPQVLVHKTVDLMQLEVGWEWLIVDFAWVLGLDHMDVDREFVGSLK